MKQINQQQCKFSLIFLEIFSFLISFLLFNPNKNIKLTINKISLTINRISPNSNIFNLNIGASAATKIAKEPVLHPTRHAWNPAKPNIAEINDKIFPA